VELAGADVAGARLEVLPCRKTPPVLVAEVDAGDGVLAGSEDIVVEMTGRAELVANAGREDP